MEIITKKDIEKLLKNNKKSIDIENRTIITSEARDLIAKNHIQLNQVDACLDNLNEGTNSSYSDIESKVSDLPKTLVLSLYYFMLKIRLFEEFTKSFRENEIIPGVFVHSYLGEEAIAAGVCSALTDKDYITSTHRGHGHLIAKGADLNKMFAELLGKETGYCSGKGGSMHITDIDIGILGANGIVGAGLPIACGSALVSKFEGDRNVTVSFFGDGATNQGTFGESLNFAKIFSLPVLFLCENNRYAVSTPISYGCSNPELTRRAKGYDIEAVSINGDDVFEVYNTAKHYIDKIRKDPHPVFIEAKTHRRIGHWVGDPQKYRSASEMSSLPDYDPLKIFLNKVKVRSDIGALDLEEINKRVAAEVKEAAVFAQGSPYPPKSQSDKEFLKEEV